MKDKKNNYQELDITFVWEQKVILQGLENRKLEKGKVEGIVNVICSSMKEAKIMWLLELDFLWYMDSMFLGLRTSGFSFQQWDPPAVYLKVSYLND